MIDDVPSAKEPPKDEDFVSLLVTYLFGILFFGTLFLASWKLLELLKVLT
jgi:hypothetical protein